MKRNLIFYCLIGILLLSCTREKKGNTSDIDNLLQNNTQNSELSISEESMNEIIQSLPSPLEISSIIKESGHRFNQDLLNDTKNADKFSTDVEKAVVMGMYSGDLGYINIYEENHLAVSYLGTIKKIADDLKVGHFFDFEMIRRIASNSDKLDSLLFISTMAFEKMDSYLRDQKRSKISVMMVTGTWLESLYLATHVAGENNNRDLVERIAEQKMILDKILLIVSAYDQDDFVAGLEEQLKMLKENYSDVEITYNYGEPETREIDGRLVIIDNSSTTVEINDDQLGNIRKSINSIREKLILNI